MLRRAGLLGITTQKWRAWMSHFIERTFVFFSLSALVFLVGCGPNVECDSPETRAAVLQTISDDHRNALANFAAKRSNVAEDVKQSSDSEKTKPLYLLGEKIVTTSTSEDKRTLNCSGAISATVGDTKASKEINFTVQRPKDGKISVSVTPFQF
jgi:hypothetical protein